MTRRHGSTRIVLPYVLSLVVVVSLLVVWVVYVVRSVAQIRALVGRAGFTGANTHWIVLAVGCSLLALLIVGLTLQLAQALAANRYARKQEEFVSHVTHELKSPLAAIKLHAQTLQDEGLSPADRGRSAAYVQEQADRMSRLVDAVLESSRLLARKHKPEPPRVELAAFFDRYLAAVAPRLADQGVRLVSSVHTASTVVADPPALERVLDNLLDNAARFSEPGGEVRFWVRDDDLAVRIEVEDDGIGIPRKDLTRIFERFYQVGGPEQRRRGTGLGLSIVADLVREMRGRVEAISQEGRGSRFVVELPRQSGGLA